MIYFSKKKKKRDNRGRNPLQIAKERHAFKTENVLSGYLRSVPPPLVEHQHYGSTSSPMGSISKNSNWKRRSGDVIKTMIQPKSWRRRSNAIFDDPVQIEESLESLNYVDSLPKRPLSPPPREFETILETFSLRNNISNTPSPNSSSTNLKQTGSAERNSGRFSDKN